MSENHKITEKEYEIYFAERNNLIEKASSQSNSYDRYLLTLAGGTFGLTVTFITEVLGDILINTKWIITTSWACLCFTILLVLLSFQTSVKAYHLQIEILENDYFKNNCTCTNYWTNVTGVLNILSGVSFVIGIVLLFIFVVLNI